MPTIPKPRVPQWLDPEQASVTEDALTQALRQYLAPVIRTVYGDPADPTTAMQTAMPTPLTAVTGKSLLKLGGAMKTIPIGKAAESASAITQSATAGTDLASRIRPLVGFDKYNVENVLDAIQTGNSRNVESALLRGGLSPEAILRLDPMTIQPLPTQMSPAAYARADAAGYPLRVFHASRNPNLQKLPSAIAPSGYDFGFHAGEPATAGRFIGGPTLGNFEPGDTIYPLVARVPEEKIVDLPDMGMWKSPEKWIDARANNARQYPVLEHIIQKLASADAFPSKEDSYRTLTGWVTSPEKSREFQKKLQQILLDQGYDAIRYPNTIEGLGEPSYLFLRPEQVRSPFAKFDPAKRNVNNILASLLGAVATGSAMATHASPDEQ